MSGGDPATLPVNSPLTSMPYQISWDRRHVFLKFHGEVPLSEIQEAAGVIHGDPRFDQLKYEICDLLEADLSSIDDQQAEEPAAMDRAASLSLGRLKVALVVTDPHAVELCLHYIEESKRMGSPWQFGVFSRIEEAMDWGES